MADKKTPANNNSAYQFDGQTVSTGAKNPLEIRSTKEAMAYKNVKSIILRLLGEQLLADDRYDNQSKMSEADIDKAIATLSNQLDSLDMVELIMKVEQAFEIIIPLEVENSIKTVDDAIGYICKVKGVAVPNKVSLKTCNKCLYFTQDGKTLSLTDGRVAPYVKMLKDALERQK
jgi:acyl carrier protein